MEDFTEDENQYIYPYDSLDVEPVQQIPEYLTKF